MKEFTFGEIKQGLICCTIYQDCKGCPFYTEDDFSCMHQLLSAAMNCINVMEKDLTEANKRAADWEEFARNMSREV
jgi:hypothetical protein